MTIVSRSQSTVTCPVTVGVILLKRILTTVQGCELVDWINLAKSSNQSNNELSGYSKVSGWIDGVVSLLVGGLLAYGGDM